MSFLIRASLVIGALSYLAAHRDDPASLGRLSFPPVPPTASSAWDALPAEARDRAVDEGARALVRQMTGSIAATSRDTLAETDRRPAWRGADGR